MLSALLNGYILSKCLLGEAVEGRTVVAGRPMQMKMSRLALGGGEVCWPVARGVVHLHLELSTKTTVRMATQNCPIVQHVQARACRLVGTLQCHLRLRVDYAEGHGIEAGADAVHAEAYHAEVLAAPVEGPVEVALLVPSTILGARHVAEKVAGGGPFRESAAPSKQQSSRT